MSSPDLDSPQRSATRAAIDAPVRMQFDDTLEVVEGRCYNISIGGMFLDSDSVRPAGSLVRFELILEENNSVRGLGEVVWAQDGAVPGRRSGLGLKFRFLEQRDRQAIFKLVSQHIKEKLAQRPPMVGEPPVPDTALARQRRASLLGEGVPSHSPEPPAPEPVRLPAPAPPPASPAPSPADRPSRVVPIIAEGAPIPAPRPLEKKVERPLEERTWQMPTLGGASGRSNRPADPSWLDDQAGFDTGSPRAGQPAGAAPSAHLPLRPDLEDGWDDRPLGGEAAEKHHYLEDTDPAHFEHRPKPKAFPLGLVLAVVGLLALLGLMYFFFFRSAGETPPEVIRIGNQDAAAPAASSEPPPRPEPARTEPAAVAGPRTLAEEVGSAPAPPAPAGLPAADEGTTAGAEPPASEPAPTAAPARTAETGTAPAPAADRPAAGKEFQKVTGISTRKAAGGVEIVIEGDGAIPQSRVGKMRLEGREVLSLYGVSQRFEKKEIAVGDAWVKGLRIGYHAGGARGNEVRLVIDLASPSAKVTRMNSQGRTLVVLIATD